ncbi:immunoglobulin-like domain-containing protein [Bacillus sp. NPDC094106]|uniref:immunoglobulin-like domain-containing protein n=1 Tax=Bacillus sp. NPDC094106 TaxID=3363949 RepID=UPI003820CF24
MKNKTKSRIVGTALTAVVGLGVLGNPNSAFADSLQDGEANVSKTQIVGQQNGIEPVKELNTENKDVQENQKQEVNEQPKQAVDEGQTQTSDSKEQKEEKKNTVNDVKFAESFNSVQGQDPTQLPIEKFVVSGLDNGVTGKVIRLHEKDGIQYVMVQVTDGLGNTITHDIPVVLNEMPVLTVEKHKVLVEQGTSVDIVKSLGAKAHDKESGNLDIQVTGNIDISVLGEHQLTLKATDNTGLSVNENAILNVVRFKDAVVIEKGKDINTLDAKEFVEGLSGTASVSIMNVDEANNQVTVKVTDGENSITKTVNVTKNQVGNKPTIHVGKESILVKQGELKNVASAMQATATDKEDGDLTSKIKETGFDSQKLGNQTVTLSVTDSNGEAISKTVNVQVVKFAEEVQVKQGADYERIPHEELVQGFDTGDSVSIKNNNDKTITVTVKDEKGDSVVSGVVKVKENNAPVINVEKSQILVKKGQDIDILKMVHATAQDKEDGDLTSSIKVEGKVNASDVSAQTVKLIVADKQGEVAEKKITIHVVDFVDTVKIKEGFSVEKIKSDKLVKGLVDTDSVFIKDNNNGTITVMVKDDVSGDTVSASVKVQEIHAPKMTVQKDKLFMKKGTNIDFVKESGAKAEDEIEGDVTNAIQVKENIDVSKVGHQTIRLSVANKEELVSTKTLDVQVIDFVKDVTVKNDEKLQSIPSEKLVKGLDGDDKVSIKDNGNGTITVTVKDGTTGSTIESLVNVKVVEDKGTGTDDKGTNEDKGTKTDDKVKEDKTTGTNDKNKDKTTDDKIKAKEDKGTGTISKNQDGKNKDKIAVTEDKKEPVKEEVKQSVDKKVEKNAKQTSKEAPKETKVDSTGKKLPETGGSLIGSVGSILAGGLALVASLVMRRKAKKQN